MTRTTWAQKKARHHAEGRTGPINPHAGRHWQRIRAQVLAEETHCWLCGRPVDKTLTWNPKRIHPGYPTVDLIIPAKHGGPHTRDNARLAHHRCNTSRGARPATTPRPHATSRNW